MKSAFRNWGLVCIACFAMLLSGFVSPTHQDSRAGWQDPELRELAVLYGANADDFCGDTPLAGAHAPTCSLCTLVDTAAPIAAQQQITKPVQRVCRVVFPDDLLPSNRQIGLLPSIRAPPFSIV